MLKVFKSFYDRLKSKGSCFVLSPGFATDFILKLFIG